MILGGSEYLFTSKFLKADCYGLFGDAKEMELFFMIAISMI